ncbi:hypothetical protein [Magnetospirillum sulfuroxidans]|uniref:Uncharacterized protein n=1 Tax=Magnetospirillum sulfuroxidans TaxID=611300 RepID=A0ABS5IAK2_9PROT|nr:hypothetical protein [Magnetospirillum sulfuroxidans]MBR9971456.1 hypothetical protein [Magnetospirillum sulfuroxidans]
MTRDRFDDDLDALLRRYDPAQRIDQARVSRVSRAVLTRIAAEPQTRPSLVRRFCMALNAWGGMPRYAGSLALGLLLGLAVGFASVTQTQAQPTAMQLYAQAQPLSPMGL